MTWEDKDRRRGPAAKVRASAELWQVVEIFTNSRRGSKSATYLYFGMSRKKEFFYLGLGDVGSFL